MNTPHPAQIAGNIDLSQNEFWAQPPAQRHTAFAQLRALGSPPHWLPVAARLPEDPHEPGWSAWPIASGGPAWTTRR